MFLKLRIKQCHGRKTKKAREGWGGGWGPLPGGNTSLTFPQFDAEFETMVPHSAP